jgi:hypothetical protein
MRYSKSLGFWICLFVMIYIVTEFVGVTVFHVRALMAADKPLIGTYLINVPILCYLILKMSKALWKGATAPRWFLFVFLVGTGWTTISLGLWQTTLDFPNAINAQERLLMQESSRRELPWLSAMGAANLVVASLLLLPSVGRFLKERRNGLASPGIRV